MGFCSRASRPGGTRPSAATPITPSSDREHRPVVAGAFDQREHEPGETDREQRGCRRRRGARRACSSRDSGTCTDAIRSPRRPRSGRLMTNTSRHETESMSQPPRKGPNAVAMPPRPDHAPIARPRSPGRNDADTMARLLGTTSAAATPWRQRAAISEPMSGASRAHERRGRERDHPDRGRSCGARSGLRASRRARGASRASGGSR